MKQKYIYAGVEIALLGLVELLSFTALNGEYLFGWAAHNWGFYLILAVIPLLLTLFNKKTAAVFITTGIIGGIFAGNYLGNLIKAMNAEKIMEGMTGEELHELSQHPGFAIWVGILLLSLVMGAVAQIIIIKSHRK